MRQQLKVATAAMQRVIHMTQLYCPVKSKTWPANTGPIKFPNAAPVYKVPMMAETALPPNKSMQMAGKRETMLP